MHGVSRGAREVFPVFSSSFHNQQSSYRRIREVKEKKKGERKMAEAFAGNRTIDSLLLIPQIEFFYRYFRIAFPPRETVELQRSTVAAITSAKRESYVSLDFRFALLGCLFSDSRPTIFDAFDKCEPTSSLLSLFAAPFHP